MMITVNIAIGLNAGARFERGSNRASAAAEAITLDDATLEHALASEGANAMSSLEPLKLRRSHVADL
jgi:hypothetical protein